MVVGPFPCGHHRCWQFPYVPGYGPGNAGTMSLSLNFDGMLDNASTIINGLWPVFVLPVGIALGMGLLGKIIQEVRKAF
jgi:hypothetical protein